ncbi:MAG: class I SAM-dependent methyltransferase, partial [Alphaproteobacteria bacterium]|nr:class I SAM-dependent methyltransferase [Alphaproteobacteria bacterium]
ERLGAVKQARAGRAQAYFRKNAARWNQIRKLYVAEAEVEKALLEAMPMEGVGDFLDIGTGTGRILELFGDKVERGLGIDLSREMLALARANLERAGRRNCRVRHGDMYKLPVPSASFDAVAIHQVLHYAADTAAAIAEAARVLRQGGRLVIVDFAPHDLEFLRLEHAHRRLGFSDDEVEGWCRAAGLVPEGTVHLPGDPLTVTIWTVRRSRPPQSQPQRRSSK